MSMPCLWKYPQYVSPNMCLHIDKSECTLKGFTLLIGNHTHTCTQFFFCTLARPPFCCVILMYVRLYYFYGLIHTGLNAGVSYWACRIRLDLNIVCHVQFGIPNLFVCKKPFALVSISGLKLKL